MNNFTLILLESNKIISKELKIDELDNYIENTAGILPIMVQDALSFIKKYEILDGDIINNILKSNKSSLKTIAKHIGVEEDKLEGFWKLLKDLKNNVKLLPHFLTPQERSALIKGKALISDLTIDIETSQGRSDTVNLYMPIAHKIVNQYVGKSNLSKSELMSAALLGFTNAMREWDRSKGLLFKTYLSYRIQQQILNDIDKYSHNLRSTNWYTNKKNDKVLDAISLDKLKGGNDEEEFKQDYLAALGVTDEPMKPDAERAWKKIFDLLERKFNQRDVDIFYRYFGLAGYEREKSKDIAKKFKMSEGNIRNSIINKFLNFLASNKATKDILSDLHSLYNENLMKELIGQNYDSILEYLSNDDTYILLEEINKWDNKSVFNKILQKSLNELTDDSRRIILQILESDFEFLDEMYKKYKRDIIVFLSNMYPTENMSKKTDVSLLEYMEDMQYFYQKHF